MDMTRSLIVAAIASLAFGCTTDADKSLVILKNQAITGEECIVGAQENAAAIVRGQLQTDDTDGYFFAPVIKSLIAEAADESIDRRILLLGADVTLLDEDGAEVDAFNTPFTTTITPGGSAGAGFPITPPGGDLGVGAYQALITVYGRLGDGEVSSDPFPYWIDVVDDYALIDLGACSSLEAGYQGKVIGSPCNAFQESALECCSDGGNAVCPAQGPAPI
jgi:hypothetical protein